MSTPRLNSAALLLALLVASPCHAGSFDGRPKILLHVTATSKVSTACQTGRSAITDCALVTTSAVADPGAPRFVYLIADKGDLAGMAGIQCGITYQGGSASGRSDQTGVDIFSWTLCGSQEFMFGSPWPAPNSGNLILFDPATFGCPGPNPVIAGWFYLAAYSPDEMRITKNPIDNRVVVAAYRPTPCDGGYDEVELLTTDLGSIQFRASGEESGCNPCLNSCSGCSLSPASIHLTLPWHAAQVTTSVTYRNHDCPREASVTASEPWMTVSPFPLNTHPGDTRTATIAIDAWTLDPGVHTAEITLGNTAGNQTVPLTLTVLATPPRARVEPARLVVERLQDSAPLVLGLLIMNDGYETLRAHLSKDVSWLRPATREIEVAGGAEAQLRFRVDLRGLDPGDYGTDVHVMSNDPSQPSTTVPVLVQVTPAAAAMPAAAIASPKSSTAIPGDPFGICPAGRLSIASQSILTTAAADQKTDSPGFTRLGVAGYDLPAGTLHVSVTGTEASADITEAFCVEGLPAGVPVSLRVRMNATGSAYGEINEFGIPHRGDMSARIEDATGRFDAVALSAHVNQWPTSRNLHRLLTLPITVSAQEPFLLTFSATALGTYHAVAGGGGSMNGSIDFAGLPPGTRIRSCRGYEQNGPAADATAPHLRIRVNPSQLWPPNRTLHSITADVDILDSDDPAPDVRLKSITAAPEGVGPEDIQGADFGRDDREFHLRASIQGKAPVRVYTITYEAEDATGNMAEASAGVVVSRTGSVTKIDSVLLDLQAVERSPGLVQFRFSVEDAAFGVLDIYDVAGRNVFSLPFEAASAGIVDLDWNARTDQDRPAAAGIYFVRLSTRYAGSETWQSSRVTLVR